MFKVVKMRDVVRIPPRMFEAPLEESALAVLREVYEGRIVKDAGLVVSVLRVEVGSLGKIVPGDGAVYHEATFEALVFSPILHEVVEGEVVAVEDFGLLVRIGPIDAFVHKSQIADDYFSFNREQGIMFGSKTGKVVRKGDKVRARIVQIGGGHTKMLRVGLTMRQPYLGKIEWIRQEVRKARGSSGGKS